MRTQSARPTVSSIAGIIIPGIILVSLAWSQGRAEVPLPKEPEVTQGTLRAVDEDGQVILEFPLKYTSVYAEISGFLAQVEVKQHFHNPHSEKIEAVYVFPLPENSAVNEMVMVVGKRNIYGEIHKRQVARLIYEQARAEGKRTALLEQERPNIFTQSVANIQPGEEIVITIRYVQALKYDRGVYRYVFPMVVGPRFIPGGPTGKQGTGWAPDTDKVPDASRITPPVLKPGRRSGHDISLTVNLDAGLPISDLHSKSHDVEIIEEGTGKASVGVTPQDSIPNKDFVLEYRVAVEKPRSAYLTHYSQYGGYLLLMIQPRLESVTENIEPKEIFFVVDCSGSMRGYPIAKVKEAMYHCIQGISPDDTFQIIRFSSRASAFSPQPVPATRLHKEEALDYIQALSGSGGTMMIEGIKACLDYPRTPERQRIVFFMTDGFIGNDNEILAAVKEKVGNARLFSFGVGSSPNRSLLERMAELGRGTAQYIRQDQPAQPVIKDMLSRISQPFLTDVEINWAGLDVTDVYPDPIPDLFSAQPLILFARYERPGEGVITLQGNMDGVPYWQELRLALPDWNPDNGSLASVWAREKIKHLMLEQVAGRVASIEEQVTNLALDYNLMSQYTSFVAVDEIIPPGSSTTLPRTIAIPVPMPEGVSFTGVFGPPSLYPGDYVTEVAAEKAETEALRLLMPSARSFAAQRVPLFAGRPQSARARGATPMAGAAIVSGKLSEAKAPMAPLSLDSRMGVRRYAYLEEAGEDQLALTWFADEELSKELQQGYKDLYDKDRDLFNTVSQIQSGQEVDGTKANQALKKLLSSHKEAEVAVGLDLFGALALQKVEIDQELIAQTTKLVTEGANGVIRSQAIQAVCTMKQPVPLDILSKTARDEDAAVRMITAYALADDKLGKDAEPLIHLLVADKDPRVVALAIKAGTEARKDNSLIPALSDILLTGDLSQRYLAVLQAAVGLGRLAQADETVREDIQKVFVQALSKDYPTSAGEEKLDLKKAVSLIGLKTLTGYTEQDAYPAVLRLASDKDKEVQTLAVSVLAGYQKAASYLLRNVLEKDSFLDRPELLTTVVQHLRNYRLGDDFYHAARGLLEEKKVSARSHAMLRVALVEALLDRGSDKDIEYAVSLLRKDNAWKVRRAVLAKLAARQKERVLPTALAGLEDPHPVIRQIALAEAVAATAEKNKRAIYLDKLSQNPTPATCDEVLTAEGLSPDLSLRSAQELRTILMARGAEPSQS